MVGGIGIIAAAAIMIPGIVRLFLEAQKHLLSQTPRTRRVTAEAK